MHVIISSSFQIGIDFALYFSLLISFHHFSLKHFDYIAPTCQPYCTSLASPLGKRNDTAHTPITLVPAGGFISLFKNDHMYLIYGHYTTSTQNR